MNEQHEFTTNDTSVHIDSISSQFFEGFADEEYRHAFIDEHLNTFIAFQIRAIREQRRWTQGKLGELCGGKAQGWISQLENPNYGRQSLTTLKALARAFDCLLDVRFRSFRDFSDEQDRRRPGDLRVNTYREDVVAAQDIEPMHTDVTSANRIETIVVATSGKLKMAKASLASTVEDEPATLVAST
jgi:transcriptional regulator with XRE-family HTH domain